MFKDSQVVLVVKNPPANAGEPYSTPGSERSPREGHDSSLQYSYLGNSMDRGAWWATVHGVSNKSDTTATFTSCISAISWNT